MKKAAKPPRRPIKYLEFKTGMPCNSVEVTEVGSDTPLFSIIDHNCCDGDNDDYVLPESLLLKAKFIVDAVNRRLLHDSNQLWRLKMKKSNESKRTRKK